jgi:hypothetical protein
MHLDAEIIDIGININSPQHIAYAFNSSMDACFDAGADTVMFVAGDAYITEAGNAFINNHIKEYTEPGLMMVQAVELYCKVWETFVISISTKENRVTYGVQGDGALVYYKGEELNRQGSLSHDESLILDLGYLSTYIFSRKMISHDFVWPNPNKKKWLRMYGNDKASAVRHRYLELRHYMKRPLQPINYEIYKDLIEKLNLQEDYAMCNKILEEFV